MIREFKFRAWDDEYKEMRHGYPVVIKGAFSHFVEDITGSCFDKEKNNGGYIVEIMQFTGLKDKNGVEIYEGDIIHCINGSVGIITYDPETIMYKVNSNFKTGFCHPVDGYTPPLEVIGNIYENPELLREA